MGKAYTEEEKLAIKQKLWEEGLKFFHSDEFEELNIRELTKRTGISLGSFYNFYPDKTALIKEIMNYRASQKLDKMREAFPQSLDNPKKFLVNLITHNYQDMSEKINNKAIYKESFGEAFDKSDTDNAENNMQMYIDFIDDLARYWNDNGYKCKVDAKGIVFIVIEVMHMSRSKKWIPKQYFDNMLNDFLDNGINRYIKEL